MRAGFVPGWNEFLSFDDVNLERCQMPYRTEQAVHYFKNVLKLTRDRTVYKGPAAGKLTLFLGNAHADARTIRETLRVVDEAGFGKLQFGEVIHASRVFEMDGKLSSGTQVTVFSIDRKGRKKLDPMYPTFHYPPDLLAHLGSEPEVDAFFSFVRRTFLCTEHRRSLRPHTFVPANISVAGFCRILEDYDLSGVNITIEDVPDGWEEEVTSKWLTQVHSIKDRLVSQPSIDEVRRLFSPLPHLADCSHAALRIILLSLFELNKENFTRILDHLGLPSNEDGSCPLTPYRIMEVLYRRYEETHGVIDDVRETFKLDEESLGLLQLRYFLYTNNVFIKPEYRELLYPG